MALALDLVAATGCAFLMATHSVRLAARLRKRARLEARLLAVMKPMIGQAMRRMLWTLAALASHWRRHPANLATLILGLAIATALWSGVQALNAQARKSYDSAAAAISGDGARMLVATHGGSSRRSCS